MNLSLEIKFEYDGKQYADKVEIENQFFRDNGDEPINRIIQDAFQKTLERLMKRTEQHHVDITKSFNYLCF